MLNSIVISILLIYKSKISPVLSKKISCRFYPTCSEYAVLCFQNFAFLEGLAKTLKRLRRCNPYNLDSCMDYPR